MNIKSISASAIKTYDTCPYKFYTEYVLKKKLSPHPASNLGSCLHAMFEKACKAVKSNQNLELQNPFYYKDSCIKEFNVLPEHQKTLEELTNRCLDWGYMNLDFAQGFELSAEFPLTCGIPVHGFIDRLDIDNDWNANIIDLKTQKDMFKESELKDNWQAIIYFLATMNDNPFIKDDVRISFWVLRHKIQTVILRRKDFQKIYDKLNAKTEEILKHDGDECSPSGLCQFCAATDCPSKRPRYNNFNKQEMSESVKDFKAVLEKMRENKQNTNTTKDIFDI